MTASGTSRLRVTLPPLVLLALALLRPAPTLRAAARQADDRVPILIDGGVSPPLRDIPLRPAAPARGNPALNFAGLGNGDYGFVPAGVPAHANGAVGATQYVQYANDSFAIFDKTTGVLLFGPASPATLWTTLASCTINPGPLTVRHDTGANRWVALQTARNGSAWLCLAVSTTSDASGSWRSYAVGKPGATFVSARLGIWPDAYYVAADVLGLLPFEDAFVCAIERGPLLGVLIPRATCALPVPVGHGGFTPSNLEGSAPPPAGSSNHLLTLGNDSLNLWEFHVNFTGPSSSITGPTPVAVAPFARACAGAPCIPQPGTAQLLDSHGDRLMDRVAYRNFGDHESLLVNHSVDGGGVTGIRWYEIRDPGGVPTVHQQGTYSPDSSHRWIGSVAMDRSGDIALGYSVSSSSVYPSIRYAGRTPSDAPGTLLAETSVIEGSGSQLTESGWGSLSSLALDPVDDCTFYYTNAYLMSSGTSNWSTRIGSFRFPGCGATRFHTVTPCRLADTRGAAGPSGGPALGPGTVRSFPVTGLCTIPNDARAVSVNVTAVQTVGVGYLTLYAGDAVAAPFVSTVNFSAGQTRGNNSVVALAADGSGTIKVRNGSASAVGLVLDVSGYFK